MLTVKVFSTPSCIKCRILKNKLTENNIEFEEVDLNSDFKAKALLLSKNLMSLPVVEIDGVLTNNSEEIDRRIF